jgi:hypothetical protein
MFSAKCFHFLKAFGSLITLLENRRVYLSKILPTRRRTQNRSRSPSLGAASSNYIQGVELLKGDVGLPAYTLLSNSEYWQVYFRSESARDNLRAK